MADCKYKVEFTTESGVRYTFTDFSSSTDIGERISPIDPQTQAEAKRLVYRLIELIRDTNDSELNDAYYRLLQQLKYDFCLG